MVFTGTGTGVGKKTRGSPVSCLKYNVDFWKPASKLNWNESALCVHYFHRLPLRLRTEVLCGGKPTTLAALHLKAQDADEIYWMMKDEASHEPKATPAKKDNKSSNNTNNNNNSKSANSSCLENPSKSAPSNDNKSSWKKDKPKDSTKLGKNGRLTTEEQEHHIKEGLCLYCGEKGHIAQDCPKSKAAKARAAAFASTDSMSESADSKK